MEKLFFTVIITMLLLTLSACWESEQTRDAEPEQEVEQEVPQIQIPEQESLGEEIPDMVVEECTAEESYAVVIGEYYTALREGWDGAKLMEAGLDYMVADCYQGTSLEDIGYGLIDVDGDGIDELLIGSRVEDDFYGRMIFALYRLDAERDNAPMLVFDSSERSRYYYAGDNRFANLGAGAFGENFETTVKLEDGEMIDMTYTTPPADYVQALLMPFSDWVK